MTSMQSLFIYSASIYERFLGKVVHATDKRVKVEEKPEVRKAGGVYYTPKYIVDYIVDNTVGKIFRNENESIQTFLLRSIGTRAVTLPHPCYHVQCDNPNDNLQSKTRIYRDVDNANDNHHSKHPSFIGTFNAKRQIPYRNLQAPIRRHRLRKRFIPHRSIRNPARLSQQILSTA